MRSLPLPGGPLQLAVAILGVLVQGPRARALVDLVDFGYRCPERGLQLQLRSCLPR
ncbi:hypothetical protein LguiA_031883 [Lonicera macranthoides]